MELRTEFLHKYFLKVNVSEYNKVSVKTTVGFAEYFCIVFFSFLFYIPIFIFGTIKRIITDQH